MLQKIRRGIDSQNTLGLIQTKGYIQRKILDKSGPLTLQSYLHHELPHWPREQHQGDQLRDPDRRRGHRHCGTGGRNIQINSVSCQVIKSPNVT